jgi:hypothetical protein
LTGFIGWSFGGILLIAARLQIDSLSHLWLAGVAGDVVGAAVGGGAAVVLRAFFFFPSLYLLRSKNSALMQAKEACSYTVNRI